MTFQSFTPTDYLKIDVATNFGLDKENWDTRIQWFDNNEEALLELATLAEQGRTAAVRSHPLMKAADQPAMFFAGLRACLKAHRGEAISYPISLDATASGAQILAILVGCEQSARLCNVIDTGRREDLYTNIHARISERAEARQVALGEVTRKESKAACMTSLYGSTAQPKRIYGEGELLELFYETMEEDAPGIWELNQLLLAEWNPKAYSHDWVLPDNFHVQVKVIDDRVEGFRFGGRRMEVTTKVNKPVPTSKSLSANVVHSIDGMVVREMLRRCCYDPARIAEVWKLLGRPVQTHVVTPEVTENQKLVMTLWDRYLETGFLSARILELLDETTIQLVELEPVIELLRTLPEQPFQVLSVHDCFRCLCSYGDDLRRTYNQILHELAQSQILASIVTQISGKPTKVNKLGDFADQILESNYALS